MKTIKPTTEYRSPPLQNSCLSPTDLRGGFASFTHLEELLPLAAAAAAAAAASTRVRGVELGGGHGAFGRLWGAEAEAPGLGLDGAQHRPLGQGQSGLGVGDVDRTALLGGNDRHQNITRLLLRRPSFIQ